MNKLKQYAKERDEMLLKRDVKELRKFILEHQDNMNPIMCLSMLNASDKVLEITLHKMIVNCTNLPFDFRQESADWLLDRGFRLDLGESEEDTE